MAYNLQIKVTIKYFFRVAKIGLIDLDGKNFPNIPLMKISAFQQKGDNVD